MKLGGWFQGGDPAPRRRAKVRLASRLMEDGLHLAIGHVRKAEIAVKAASRWSRMRGGWTRLNRRASHKVLGRQS